MPNSLDLHFEVFQVLEEEYISLYGHLEQETKTYLRDRQVTSGLDWNFHQGHIKNWVDFTSHLQKPNLNLPINLQRYLNEERVCDWRNGDQAIASLNRLLEKPIYDRQECRHIKLRETTEKLFELCSEENGSQISTEELKRLNRFLLEDLFPEHLEKVSEIRLAAIYQRRHDKEPAALCLSGGGIRSGTFALGLMQGLARHNLLTQFDYLSTVSGGGYIGAWLTAWIHRHSGPERGLAGVTSSLTNARPESKIDPEPPALRYLRENSNFLTPQVGLMSADTWTFLAIYVRNLLLNWSVLIPLLLGVLLIPRFSVAAVLAQPSQPSIRRLVLLLGFISASWAIAYIAFSRPGLRTRLIEANPWWKERMGQRGFLRYCLLWLGVAAITLTSYWAWTPTEKKWWQFLLFGLATSLLGLFWSSFVLRSWRRKRVKTVITRRTWRESAFIAALLLLIAGSVGGLIARGAAVLVERAKLLDVDTGWTTELYVSYAVPFFLLLFMLALIVFAGISSHFLGKITEEDREWWARFSAWTFIFAIAWAVFSTLVIFGPLALLASPKFLGTVGGLSGLVALLLGRSGKTPATSEQVAQGGLKAQLSSVLLPLLAVLFIAVFIAGLSLLTSKLIRPVSAAVDAIIKPRDPSPNGEKVPRQISTRRDLDVPAKSSPSSSVESGIPIQIGSTKIGEFSPTGTEGNQILDGHANDHMKAVHYPRWWLIAVLMLLLLGFGLLMARVINLNLFSLNNSYRSRLIRGFLAASRDKLLRQPNPFTGFDPADNVSMHELRPALLHEVDFINFDSFVNQFKDAAESVKTTQPTTAAEFIYTQLSERVKSDIDEKDRDTPVSQGLRANLIEDLNRILEDEEINLSKLPGFSKPPQKSTDAQQSPEDATASEGELRLEYHIHRNRRAMELTYPQFIEKSDYPPYKLLHVVNTTLNLVGGDNLAWQQRKAEPFTISPLHCGSYRVGYRRSKDYGGDDGISLGTAMAISGAAASSNMGYFTTSPVLSLVLTLFNVRLGWWLGNPGPAGSHSYGLKTDERPSKKIYRRMSPTLSVLPVLYEAFGLTDDRSDYIYLTDGGHFENLALYEMVLRRCKLIVVSDAAADTKYRFNDLANAVRKVRIDLGVPIEFPDVPIYREAPSKAGEGGCYWAVGLIRYSQIDRQSDGTNAKDGVLIYIKPAVYGDEPEDVVHYKRTHPTFPNETTADQFFDEPQFESYRALGSYIMDRMCGSHSGDLSKPMFVSKVISNLVRLAPQTKEKYLDFWGDLDKARDPLSQVRRTRDG
ncbi:MAG: patatin-like phospholipase family protein [Pyrinomonadaceae bacterium]